MLRRLIPLLMLLAAPRLHAHQQPPAGPPAGPEGGEKLVLDLVRNSARHWSFAVPQGWTLAAPEVAQRLDDEMNRLMPDKGFRCVAVVWADPARGTKGPNIQVQFVEGVTLDQLVDAAADARQLAELRRREREAAGERLLASDETLPVLDRGAYRLTSRGSLTAPAGPDAPGKAQVIRFENTAFLGKLGLTRLIVYAPAEEFDAAHRQATDAIESFQYEKGWGYEPPTPQSALTTLFARSGWAVVAVIAIVFILRVLTRRKRQVLPRP